MQARSPPGIKIALFFNGATGGAAATVASQRRPARVERLGPAVRQMRVLTPLPPRVDPQC